MLKLTNIKKTYEIGDTKVEALKGISVEFRDSEFVSVLGPSGCGKTTLLNIIGGLDRFSDGDLVISGKSTKKFKDRDWDSYRNHSIGFVFQSYNLIPHQTVLSNVELALTLSGVSKAERRKRAINALESVGLGDQLNKKPNQMSGGQMQRVAIARALVNDPEILLADEPTGALDSTTSVQIMELLKSIAKDRLVIMVTHNPELAEQYSTRIIRLLDGNLISDTAPYDSESAQKEKSGAEKRTSMSLFTALSLSLNNLMTKKARTLMIAFAGSIGIIGIALILSVSTGVQQYIDRVQEDTLSSYPLSIREENVDMSSLITTLMDTEEENEQREDDGKIYENEVVYRLMNSANSLETDKNNLSRFKKYIESNEEFAEYVSAVQYQYDVGMDIYAADENKNIFKTDVLSMMENVYGNMGISFGAFSNSSTANYYSSYNVWEQLLSGTDGKAINDIIYDQYTLIYGNWPKNYDEAVLIVNKNNEISDLALYSLGLKNPEELSEIMSNAMNGKQIDTESLGSWTYEEICNADLRLILPCDRYQKNKNGFSDLSETEAGMNILFNSDSAVPIKLVGIVKPSENAVSGMINGSIGYISKLTDFIIERTADSEIVKAQLADESVDAISGLKFKTDESEPDEAEKETLAKEYITILSDAELAQMYKEIKSTASDEYLDTVAMQYIQSKSEEELVSQMMESYAEEMGIDDMTKIEEYVASLDRETLMAYISDGVKKQAAEAYKTQKMQALSSMTDAMLSQQFKNELAEYDNADYVKLYDEYMPKDRSERTYDSVLSELGYAEKDKPTAINIYAATFADKDKISELIDKYNESLSEDEEEDKIEYTDYVALIMSSVSTVISAISYVLIAFVAISLVVSSIMIGIITYISVLERTKEIGILRAMGASKKDIARVFNAETLIVGFAAGLLGILITLLLIIPINLILHHLTGIMILSAALPVGGAICLIIISMLLTFIAGLIPARIAAKKDPVTALRTE